MRKKLLILLVSLFLLIIASGCAGGSAQRSKFDRLMEDYFLMYMSDPMTVNYTLDQPENFDLDDLEVTPYSYSEKEIADGIKELGNLKKRLRNIRYRSLTYEQRITYDIVAIDIDNSIGYFNYPYHLSNFGILLGYQVMLPVVLAEYRFNSEKDINDYFAYLSTTQETFEGMMDLEKARVSRGFGFPPDMYSQMAEQCEEIATADELFLVPILNEKINAASFLSAARKSELKAQHANHIADFIDAYEYLQEEFENIQVTNYTNKGLSSFENGTKLYELIVLDKTGCDWEIDDIYDYLEEELDKELDILYDYIYANPSKINDVIQPSFLPARTERALYNQLLSAAAADFPIPDEGLSVRFETVNPILNDYLAPAFYMLSPIDAQVEEVIYMKDEIASDSTAAYFTLGHEGIPGHMLQHNAMKNSELPYVRMVLDLIGYSEGWAIYAEEYVGKYLDINRDLYAAYLANERATALALCLAEIQVHYNGYAFPQFKYFIEQYFSTISEADAYDIFYQILETPGYFLEYYLSYYLLKELKESFIDELQAANAAVTNYDYEFHKFYLEFGPAPFYIMEKWMMEYIKRNYD